MIQKRSLLKLKYFRRHTLHTILGLYASCTKLVEQTSTLVIVIVSVVVVIFSSDCGVNGGSCVN